MERLSLLSEDQVRAVQLQFGTPTFVYDQKALESQAQKALAFPNAHGLTVRYAVESLSGSRCDPHSQPRRPAHRR